MARNPRFRWQTAGRASRTGETFARRSAGTGTSAEQTYAPLPFGKHRGRTLPEVYPDDASYVEWLARQSESTSHAMRVFSYAARSFLRGVRDCRVSDVRSERKAMPRRTHSRKTRPVVGRTNSDAANKSYGRRKSGKPVSNKESK